MNDTLRVYVGERWPEQPGTRWVLLDPAGHVLEQGESDALRWPAAEFCEAILAAPQAAMLRAALPARVARGDLLQVVAGAIEDQLIEDVDHCHLTMAVRRREDADVLVVSRQRLRNVLTQFAALGRPLSALYSELQCLPANTGEWTLALTEETAVAVGPDALPISFDRAATEVPPLLVDALSMQAADLPPLRLLPAPMQSVDLATWKTTLNSERIVVGPEYHWYRPVDRAVNLLHGEFPGRRRKPDTWLLVRPAVLVAGSAVILTLLVGLVQSGLQHYRIQRAEARIAELFRATFPGVPIVAPVAQTRRQLDQLRETRGLSRSDDMVMLLAALADALGPDGQGAIRELSYVDRRLKVVLDAAMAARLADLRQALGERGYQASAETTAQNQPALSIEMDRTR